MSAPTRLGRDTTPREPATEHRIVTVVAAASLLTSVGGLWVTVATRSPTVGTAFGAIFPVLLLAIGIALGARTRRLLVGVDLVLIVIALGSVAARVLPRVASPRYSIDESVLMARAIEAVAGGRNPYAGDWTAEIAKAPTLLLDGTNPGRFGYPPLSPLLGGALAQVVGAARAPVVLSGLGLLATAVILYRMLPVSRRALVVPATVTLTGLPFLAESSFPTALMLPLLVVACYCPARIGVGGTLGRRGVIQAVALGLAIATHQLAWFVAPFLLVAIWRARRGELDRRPAAVVVLRVAGIAAAVFAVVNLPFAIAGPRIWLRGITDPLVQHAMFNGPGLPNLTLRIVGGGGQLAYWSATAAVIFVTLLVTLALWPRLLGAGLVLLPFVALWASLRAQTIYYSTALPLAIAAAGTDLPGNGFANARPLRLGRLPRLALPALGGAAALLLAGAALASPAPLTVRVTGVTTAAATRSLGTLTLQVRNRSDHDVEPHVTVGQGVKFAPFLRQVSGPQTLRPGQSATLVLVPGPARPILTGIRDVFVVSDGPQTLSSAKLPTPIP